jgi:hypothetical protein
LRIPSRFSRYAATFADSLVIFLATAALIRPLFKARYLAFWSSIESTFIADARFLVEHWPHPGWQPLWYAGTRFDYIYPPALRYGTALVSMIFGYAPAKAYHVYTAFFYCLGIVGVYLLIRAGSGSRRAAWLGAAAAALLSPSFLFMKNFRDDAWMLAPQRLGVLVKYGEGPHISSVALLPFALAFAWLALDGRSRAPVALAAVFCAGVVSHNFYGATSLAMFYAILVWSFWVTRGGEGIWPRAAAIPALAYGLTAVWLTPSYLKITTVNMQYVSSPGNARSIWIALLVGAIFLFVSFRLGRGRAERTWPIFVYGSAVFFSLNVLGNYYFNFRVYGEPHRLAPELDLTLILAALLPLVWLWNRPRYPPRVAAAAFVVAAFATSAGYVRHAWSMYPLSPNYQKRVEYKISEWLWRTIPDARVFASGSVRFWFDAWHDLTQLGGGSEQGLLNGIVELPYYEITMSPRAELSVLWLECLGVDAVYVSDQRSEEVYKDFKLAPKKFDGVLPEIYDDGEGNIIYRVPRRYPSRVRVVEAARLSAARSPRDALDNESVRAYADVIEHGPDSPATLTRTSPTEMRLHATMAPGQSVLVQESYDPAWRAWSGGQALAVHKDAMGFMAIDAPSGSRDIALVFTTPLENQVGRIVTAISMLIVIGLLALSAASGKSAPARS